MAESFLKHGIESLSGADRHQIIVHVDADTLADGCEGRCEIEEGPSMAAETARRLTCDSTVIPQIVSREPVTGRGYQRVLCQRPDSPYPHVSYTCQGCSSPVRFGCSRRHPLTNGST